MLELETNFLYDEGDAGGTPPPEEHGGESKVKPSEVLRELSKQFAIDLFEKNGVTQLKEKLLTQSNEYKTLQEKVETLTGETKTLKQKEQDYQIQIEALGLGFKAESLTEVLALAKVNMGEGQSLTDGLKAVREKYGSLFAVNKGIGTQFNDLPGNKQEIPKTEEQKYLEQSKAYQAWQKQNKN